MIFYPRRGAGFAIRRRTLPTAVRLCPAPTPCVGGGWAVAMAKQRNSLRKRLAHAIERVRNPPLLALLRVRLPTIEVDYSNKRVREIHANVALTLPGRSTDSPLQKAFDAFGLDLSDPFNWRRYWTNLQTSFSVNLHAVAVLQ
jgi:hypothetical protein